VNLDYEKSLLEKSSRELGILDSLGLLRGTRIQRVIASPRKLGYRTIFKLAARRNPDSEPGDLFRLGMFDPGTHQIGPELDSCPLHHARLRQMLKALRPLLNQSGLRPYSESDHTGDLRYVIARTNQTGDQIIVTWVVTQPHRDLLLTLTEKLKEEGFPLVVSAMNVHPEPGNAIWGKETVLLTREAFIEEQIAKSTFYLGPTSFFQVNPWQAENIYLRIEKIAQTLPKKKVAWDLFSGVGTIACFLGHSFEKVLSVEENSEAASLAAKNVERNQQGKKIQILNTLVEKSADHFPLEFQKPDLIVANPSRRGIHADARALIMSALKAQPGSECIYLSCDVNSFSRDLKYFNSVGLSLFELQGFDMHAQTSQMEWLGRLKMR